MVFDKLLVILDVYLIKKEIARNFDGSEARDFSYWSACLAKLKADLSML